MAEQQTANVVNGIDLDALESTVSAIEHDPQLGRCRFRARNRWVCGSHNHTTVDDFYAAGQEQRHQQSFELDADAPPLLAGDDQALNPLEYLLTALAGSVTTSIVAHAAIRGIHIEELESELEGDIDLNGFMGLSDAPRGYTEIRVKFKAKTDANNLDRLRRLAEYSPVLNTLSNGTFVDIQVEPK